MGLNFIEDIYPGKLSKKQLTDSGMALVLILLIVGVITGNDLFYKLAIPVLILDMTVPRVFYPFAVFWFSLSNLLGLIVSRILLGIIYFALVVPIGLIRKILGKDTLDLKRFKKGSGSVLKKRDYTFASKDITSPY